MLRDPVDFDYAISKVMEEMDLYIDYQEEVLDSEKMNNTFLSIEKNLNKLYEDTRHIQDAIDYCKTFLTVKIDEYSDDIYTVVKSIEDIADINKNMSYIEYPIKFFDNKIAIPDRDKNYILNSTTVNNNNLVLGTEVDKTWGILSVDRKCDFIPYYDNLDKLGKESYRAMYVEEKIGSSGVVETIVIKLAGIREVNFIDVAPVNCKIKNVRYVYLNGIEEYIGDLETGISPESRMLSHIKFDIVCDKYTKTVYTIDKTKMSDNIWKKIKEYEYNINTNINSKLEAEGIIKRVSTKANGEETTEVYSKTPKSTVKITMYSYSFGLDYLDIKRIVQYEDGYFISDPIEVGKMKENEYIQLNVKQTQEDCFGTEFYILDGEREIPICPIGIDHIENERIFPENPLVFPMDESQNYIIKNNGVTTDISLDDALNQYDMRYSIDYFPGLTYNYTPMMTSIRVKAVMRTYGNYIDEIPKISKMNIRKYGGENLWINRY